MLGLMTRLGTAVRASADALREALANTAIRRLEVAWGLGIAADGALSVVLLVAAYQRGGVLAAGLFGAFRMVPAVVSGMLAGAVLQRVDGRSLLLGIGLVRTAVTLAASALLVAGAPLPWLLMVAAVAGAAAAPVVPTTATLMPAAARTLRELVAANVAYGIAEGAGGLVGPFVAAVLIAAGQPSTALLVAAAAFALTVVSVAGLRFEQAEDAGGRAGEGGRSLRLRDGIDALRRSPVLRWSLVAVYGQVLTRGVLNTLAVVAAIELLAMGDGGVGLLSAALGLGGLAGALVAMSLVRADRLVRTESAAVALWGVPIAIIGLLPYPAAALGAMVLIGVANAVFDVAVHTVLQRGSSNAERSAVFSALEAVVGLGALSGSLLGPLVVALFDIRLSLVVTGAFLPILALVVYGRVGRIDRITLVEEPLVDLLGEVPAFRALPLTAIERLAEGAVATGYARGTAIMREGDSGDCYVVIDKGEVEISVAGRIVDRLGHGEGVGEIALLRRSPRTATVIAVSDVGCYCIDGATFLAAVSGPAAAPMTEGIAAARLERG
jgi:MFS family permease